MVHRSSPFVAVVVLFASVASAEPLTIEHSTVGCVVAEKYPRFAARFTPPEAVAKARVLFQPKDAAHWYAVAMRPEGAAFHGILPKPKKSLEAFRYYIEVTDKAASTSRTPDQTATVVGTAAECQGKMVAGALGSASVALEVPAGAPAVPAGFASGGVAVAAGAAAAAAGASAGGGFPTTAVLIGAAGAAAAGGAVVVAKGGEPSKTTYSGAFNGEYTQGSLCTSGGGGGGTCTRVFASSGTASVTLEEESNGSVKDVSGLRLTGTFTEIRFTGGCVAVGNMPFERFCKLSGSASALTCRSQNEGGPITNVFEFSGALSGGAITGNVTLSESGRLQSPGGLCTIEGSGGFPVSLR
jgi:hypothetical protein